MTDNAQKENRLLAVGPMPPPINGQSVVMTHLVPRLAERFPSMRLVDTSIGEVRKWARPITTLCRYAVAWWPTIRADVVYVAVKAGHGMWLTTIIAVIARMANTRLFLHHHSYAYVRERKLRMVALTLAAGPEAQHVVLSKCMARDLYAVMPEISKCLVIGNAGLVDASLIDLPLKSDGDPIVFGHLSNLSPDKGIAEVVNLMSELRRAGTHIRLIVGGSSGKDSRQYLDRARSELGDLFEYRGPLAGEAKRAFFAEITHFLFPSRYVHEAIPLVLYEALAAGVVCVATRQGAISEQLEGTPSCLVSDSASFVEEAAPVLAGASVSAAASQDCREAFIRARSDSERQLKEFVAYLGNRQ